MIRTLSWTLPFFCATLVFLPTSVNAAGLYTLRLLVSSGDTIDGLTLTDVDSNFNRNDLGQIAFKGDYAGGSGIFTRDAVIAKTGDVFAPQATITDVFVEPDINNSGLVAYRSAFTSQTGTHGIFTSDAGLLIQNTDTVQGNVVSGIDGVPRLNNSGEITLIANLNAGTRAVIRPNGDILTQVGDTIDGQTLTGGFLGDSINNNGDVIFIGQVGASLGVFSPSEHLIGPGDTFGGETLTRILGSPALSDSGEVTSLGLFGAQFRIFTTDQGIIASRGDVVDGHTLFNLLQPDINASGTVAYVGQTATGNGIFTQDGVVALPGEIVDGKTIGFIEWPRIDEAGNIAFSASFGDGTTGIVLAQIPEPSSAVLATMALASLLSLARRRRRRST